jgi:hypothetical protein
MTKIHDRTQRDSEIVVAAIRRCVEQYRQTHIVDWEPSPTPDHFWCDRD